jgi:hypothetical protein
MILQVKSQATRDRNLLLSKAFTHGWHQGGRSSSAPQKIAMSSTLSLKAGGGGAVVLFRLAIADRVLQNSSASFTKADMSLHKATTQWFTEKSSWIGSGVGLFEEFLEKNCLGISSTRI